MKRSPLKRGRSLARGKAIKRANPRRRKATFARNFGDEAALVRSLPCLVCGGLAEPAHVTSRGAGGGRFDLVPLCRTHHDEQHSAGVESFADRHGLDLRAEADRVALLHDAPLGVRGLALREADGAAMTAYERSALYRWVRGRARAHTEDLPALEDVADSLRIHVAAAEAIITSAEGWP